MNQKIQRNAPCPCGSGRKYKKCCLVRARGENPTLDEEKARERRNKVFRHAVDWLDKFYPEELDLAVSEFGWAAEPDGRELSESDEEYLWAQSLDWALADGMAEIGGGMVRLRDLVLEKGPLLEADQRLWFERATQEPLRLWRLVQVDPGVGMRLRDLLDDSAEEVYVEERLGSQELHRNEVIAARLAWWKNHWEIATIFTIPSSEVMGMLDYMEDEAEGEGHRDPDILRRQGYAIRDFWVWLFTREQRLPEMLDAAGESLELITDHWQILDEEELIRRLEAEPDVVGSRKDGWTRLEEPEAEMGRALQSLNPGKAPDRLEVFSRSRRMADEGRDWLEKVAGPTLKFLVQEIVDPLQSLGDGSEASGVPEDPPDVPPEVMSQLVEKVYRREYADIAEAPVPMFGHKAPKDVLKEPGGEKKIRLWLEGFESNEERMAAGDRREPVDLTFLWEALGLEPSPR